MNNDQEINLFANEKTDPFSNGEVFDASAVVYQPEMDEEKQLYWLKRHIVTSFRKAGITNNFAKDYADRNALSILLKAKEKITQPACAEGCGCHAQETSNA